MLKCQCGCGLLIQEGKKFTKGHNRRGVKNTREWSYDKDYIISKFESNIEVDIETGCWVWIGSIVQEYGGMHCCYEGFPKPYPAHRLSYIIYVGDIPEGLQILHKCNNKPCVNPDHLYVGTHEDNMRDLREAGTLAGENNPNYGVSCSKEKKEKISIGVKKWIYDNPDFDSSRRIVKKWLIVDPNGTHTEIGNISKFCRDKNLKLSSSNQGFYIIDKGWKIERMGEE